MTLTCCIIDDEPLAVDLLKSYVEKTPFLELKSSFHSALKALNSLVKEPVDVLFLDIQMPILDGLEFSRILTKDTRVIFTTAFAKFAIEGFKVNALDYLLKPVSYTDFLTASQKALQWYEMSGKSSKKEEADSIYVKSEYKQIRVELNKILYIEGLKDYVKIYLEETPRPILTHVSLKYLESILPESRFVRVHKSFIVQPNKINTIERNRIIFDNKHITISDSYKDAFYEFLNRRSIK